MNYHKIQTVYLRDPGNNHKTLLDGRWAAPEFEYLSTNMWWFTEKVDGTNIRVIWDGERVTFGGKTDRAQIPTDLLDRLLAMFPASVMEEQLKGPVVLCGEGYGPKIQKGGDYTAQPSFVLFDVWSDVWLEQQTVQEIAEALKIHVVPTVGVGTLHEAVEMARVGFESRVAEVNMREAEGLVMRPRVELLDRRGHRVIAKIKHKDFSQEAT